MHLVTLACLIQFLKDNGVTPFMGTYNKRVCEYIMEDLAFQKYWSGGLNHVELSKSDNIFNLWRITDTEKDLYAKHVEKYLRSNYFEGKDLGAVSLCLAEAFYNVFDHAQAKGNAFSLLAYDVDTSILRGAICDFGVGLATTIRKGHPEVLHDAEAIRLSIKDNITIGSTARNRGLGMGNIVNNTDSIRILSGNGLYVKNDINNKTVQIPFTFPGTLIYFDIDLSTLEDETLLDNFNW
ncbi:MAG: ATP-binding protein [Paramuribaculum sp.]|nr:ATP-binding protein [Paramuribaculum sp.]